jgi:hypothetical protein
VFQKGKSVGKLWRANLERNVYSNRGYVCYVKTTVRWRKMSQTAERPVREYIHPSRQSWAGHLTIYQYRIVMATDTFDTNQPLRQHGHSRS